MEKITPVVRNLLIINIGIFCLQKFLNFDLIHLLGLRYVNSPEFMPYQFFTHIFVHANFRHLLGNMFALFTLGSILERTLSSKDFISFYLFTGIGAAFLYAGIQYVELKKFEPLYQAYLASPTPQHFLVYLDNFAPSTQHTLQSFITDFSEYPDHTYYIAKSQQFAQKLYSQKINMPTVGASGSIFGVFMAFAMLFPNVDLFFFFIPFPIKAKYAIFLYGLYEFWAIIANNPADNVAHFAHIGGILYAYIFIKWWLKFNQHRFY